MIQQLTSDEADRKSSASDLRRRRVTAVAWMIVVLGTVSARGQSPPPTVLNDVNQIYVPAEDLEPILSRDKQGVLLPRPEFVNLLEQARKNVRETPNIPNGIAVAGAEFRGRVSGSQLVLRATIKITQLTDGWRFLRLPFRGVAIESATLDEKPALLARGPGSDQALNLFHDQKGPHILVLDLVGPVASAGGDRVTAFGLASLPVGTLEMTVSAGERLFVDELQLKRPAPLEKATVYTVPVGGKEEIRLRISERALEHASDRLVFGETAYRILLAPGDATWRAVTSLNVFGAGVDRLTVTIPPGLKIAEVDSTGLESWNITEHPDQKPATIVLAYRQPIKGTRSIRFQGILQPASVGHWAIQPLKIAGITSHIGRIRIEYPPDLRFKLEKAVGVRTAVVPATEQPVRTPPPAPSIEFDAWNENFAISFLTEAKQRETFVHVLTAIDVADSGLELQLAATMESLYGPLFEAELTLPAEWSVSSVTISGKPVTWQTVSAEAGTHHLLVPMRAPTAAGTSVPLVLTARRAIAGWPIDEAGVEFSLPEVRFPNAGMLVGSYVIKASEDFELTPTEVTGLDPAHLNLPQERIGYRYQDTRIAAKLKITRRPARLSAQTIAVCRLDPAALRTYLQTTIEARGGGFRRLDLFLPETAGQGVRFHVGRSDVPIVEQKVSEPIRGERLWTLSFGRYVKGTIKLQTVIDLPRGAAKEFLVPLPRLEGVASQSGYVIVQAATDQEIKATAVGADKQQLSEVDPADLPPFPFAPSDRVVAAYRFVQPGNQVTLAETRFQPVGVARAVCKTCDLETIVGKQGSLQHRALFHFIASGVQSLSLTLPADSVLWGTLVDGQPVEVRKAAAMYQVPLPAASSPDADRSLMLFYATPQGSAKETSEPQPFEARDSRLRQSPPNVSVVDNTGASGRMEILSRSWRLYFPMNDLVTQSDGAFEPTVPLTSDSLLGQVAGSIGKESTRQLLWKMFDAIVAIVVIALCVMGYARWRTRGVLVACSVIATIGCCWLFLSLTSQENRSATYFAESSQYHYALSNATSMPKSAAPAGGELSRPAIAKAPVAAPVPESAASRINGEPPSDRTGRGRFGAPVFGTPVGNPGPKTEFTGGGRLSVPIDFEVPKEARFLDFQFFGREESAEASPTLEIRIGNLWRDRSACLAMIALVAYLCWCVRRVSWRRKSLLATIGLVAPLALVAIVPVTAQIWLDGLFFGTLAGLVLWGIHACVKTAQLDPRAAQMATLVIALFFGAASAPAAEPITNAVAKRPIPQPKRDGVILPYDSAKDPLSADRVFLDRRTFLELWNQAHPEQPIGKSPPHDGVVTAAIYSAKILTTSSSAGSNDAQSAQAKIAGRLVLESFVDRPVTITLPFQQVALKSANLDGKTAFIVTRREEQKGMTPATRFDLVLATRGQHVLDVEIDVPVRLIGPAGEFTVPLLPVASGRFSFELPSGAAKIRVTGAETGFRKRQESGKDWVDIAVASVSELTIAWQPDVKLAQSTRSVEARGTTAISVEDAGLRVRSRYALRVAQGTASEFVFSLPPKLKLQEIRGSDVAGWKIEGDDPSRKLTVSLRRSVSGETQLDFDFFQEVEIGESPTALAAPLIAPLEVVRDTGTIALFAGRQFDVRSGTAANALQIDARDFDASLLETLPHGEPELAYRYLSRPVRLEWLVARRRSEVDVAALYAVVVGRRKLTTSSRFRFQVSGTALTRAEIVVPPGFLALAVQGPNVSDWFISDLPNGGKSLIVEFSSPQAGTFDLILNGMVRKAPDDSTASIQVPVLMSARRAHADLSIWLDESYQATIADADGWKSADLQQVPADMKALVSAPPQLAFQTNQPKPGAVVLNLARAAARLTGDSAAIVTATDTSVFYTLSFEWTISQAATDTFTLTTPDWLAGRLDFADPHAVNAASPRLRQVTSVKLPDGRVRWTLSLQDPVVDRFFLTATAILPFPTESKIAVPTITFEDEQAVGAERRMQPLDRQRHFLVLVNQSSAQLVPLDAGSIEPVDRTEIPIKIDAELLKQALQVGRLVRKEAPLAWQLNRTAVQKGAPAFINLAELVTVVEHGGAWRTRAVYRVKNLARQFLAIRIPPNSEILAVQVQEKPSRPVESKRGKAVLNLIPLPAVSEADLSFEVRVIVAGQLPTRALAHGLQFGFERLPLPVPQVVSPEDDAEYGIPVARTQWTTYFPDDLHVFVVDESGETNVNPAEEGAEDVFQRSALIDEAKQLLSVVRSGPSDRLSYRARSNLKELQTKLGTSVSSSSSRGRSEQDAEKVEKEIDELEQLHETEARQQAASAFDRDDKKQLNAERQAAQATELFNKNFAAPPPSAAATLQGLERLSSMGRPNEVDFLAPSSENGERPPANLSRNKRSGTQNLALMPQQAAKRAQLEQQAADDHSLKDLAKQLDSARFADKHGGEEAMAGVKMQNMDEVAATDELGRSRTPGSLSLAFDIPTKGQKLVFTKAGGDPKLTVSIWPRESFTLLLDVAWALVWGGLGIAVIAALGRATFGAFSLEWLPRVVMAVGLAIFLLLPAPLGWTGLIALTVGTAIETLRRGRAFQTNR